MIFPSVTRWPLENEFDPKTRGDQEGSNRTLEDDVIPLNNFLAIMELFWPRNSAARKVQFVHSFAMAFHESFKNQIPFKKEMAGKLNDYYVDQDFKAMLLHKSISYAYSLTEKCSRQLASQAHSTARNSFLYAISIQKTSIFIFSSFYALMIG